MLSRPGEDDLLLPPEDLGAVVLDGESISFSAQAASLLAASNVALLVSDEKHLPVGLLQPLASHSTHAETLRRQAECSQPKKKRAWQQVVQAKIASHASLLAHLGKPDRKIAAMEEKVLSGDSTNMEGQAAARYWTRLMGDDFVRDRGLPGFNSLLNYGYAVIRSLMARSLCGAGLHPALGIYHRNRYNPYALADDMMEPYRALVDWAALRVLEQEPELEALTPSIKRSLLKVTQGTVFLAGTEHHLQDGFDKLASSLRRVLCEEGRKLDIPEVRWSAVTSRCG